MSRAIELPFSISASGEVSYTEDDSKTWQDRVVSVVMTRFKERVMNPGFGSSIGEAMFYSIEDAIEFLNESVTQAFGFHLPTLTLNSVDVSEDLDEESNALTVTINFSFPRLLSQSDTQVSFKTQYISRAGEVLLEVGNA